MSWALTVMGFIALVVIHEFGHFAAAKLVGMRVERFALFIGPLLVKVRRGETEYGIAPLPLGGYVKISGMNPHEDLPPEVAPRAFFRQAVWKRVFVVAAGPAMNVVLAFLILWVLFWANGVPQATTRVADQGLRPPASEVLKPGDRIVAVDGRGGSADTIRSQIARHRCAGEPVDGCAAATPARVTVERGGKLLTFELRPRYSAAEERPLLGFGFDARLRPSGPGDAASYAVSRMWAISAATVSVLARIFDAQEREKLGGVVGASKVLNDSIDYDVARAMLVLAIISLSLAIVNLFPFLPLDGGHIFWALAEKVRGRAISFEVMERSMAVGFVLVIMLFLIGLSNDIDRLQNEGFAPR
jgi:regulator of sigma E protease